MRWALVALIGAVCAVGIWWMVARGRGPERTFTYSQFLDEVERGHVASVRVSSGKPEAAAATVRLRDGSSARTMLPWDYRDALSAMRAKLVDVEFEGARPGAGLLNSMPFLVLLAIWLLLWASGWRPPAKIASYGDH